jgi:DNA-binding transcriptional LysR family regulator
MTGLRNATLRQLRIFEAAARHLHFGRAAAELNLSQPAVSIQLKQLEADIGLPLFEKMGRRTHLTAAGEELAVRARALLVRLREADEAIEALKGAGVGELHIASTTTAEYFVPRLLAEFRRSHPRLKVRLTVKNREHVVRDLNENTVDLVVMGHHVGLKRRQYLSHAIRLGSFPRPIIRWQTNAASSYRSLSAIAS